MTKISLHTAILLAVQEAFTARQTFSAYDLTRKVRERLNNGAYGLSDRNPAVINGVSTYFVQHTEVRGIVEEWYDAGVLTNAGVSRNDNGTYMEYSFTSNPAVRSGTPAAKTSTGAATSSPANSSIIGSLTAYVNNRGTVTLKQIQSRFKGVPMTCGDIAKLVQSQDDLVLNPNPVLSLSTVQAV